MSKYLIEGMLIMALASIPNLPASAGQSGQTGHDDVLLGMHFVADNGDQEAQYLNGADPVNVTPGFYDYVKYMPEDLKHISYADFWYWWFSLERYKGDEKGLGELDAVVKECMDRGMKVKIDLAYSTWWSADLDWEKESDLVRGPADIDDWIHSCDLFGRRYRGRVALWLLQGESNQLDAYWKNKPIEYVQEVFKKGYLAFKRVDPGVKISVSGAAQCMPRAGLEAWYKANIEACKGFYDDIPMNFFADVVGGDEFHGLKGYYDAIRGMLDKVGERDVEIGSGESCVQWLLDSYNVPTTPPPTTMKGLDPDQVPLCEMKQAWRLNESLGTYYGGGGNKFMMWGTEFAPGGGWPWRWGFRKYQDWWGVWPDTHKIPGTNIVYRHDNPDGRKADLRPGWSSSQTDPYHPMWEVYKFWAQMTPPGAEAVRVPATVSGTHARVLCAATYLCAEDRCVVLLQNDDPTAAKVDLDLGVTGWAKDNLLAVDCSNESIDYNTGTHAPGLKKPMKAKMGGASLKLKLPSMTGFTTVVIRLSKPAFAAEFLNQAASKLARVGAPLEGTVVIRNTGTSAWARKQIRLAPAGSASGKDAGRLAHDVAPGETVAISVKLPAPDAPGYVTHALRLRGEDGAWFGPAFSFSATVTDPDAPRKFVAFREVGHVRLKWFAPEGGNKVREYEVQRAEGFDMPFSPLTKTTGADYLDTNLTPDKVYYYRVTAIDRDGHASRPSNEDNAAAITKPRFYDAEIVQSDVPAAMRQGTSTTLTIGIKNTGSKAWDLGDTKRLHFRLNTTQQWGVQNEAVLPDIALDDPGVIKPGDTVTLSVPLSAPKVGRFENHWVVTMDVIGKWSAYFGTPLLVETVVTPK